MRLQSAIFDMDGTLLDSMGMWKNVGIDVLHSLGYQPGPEFREQIKTMTLRQGTAFCRETFRMPQSEEEIQELFRQRVERFYRQEVRAKPGVPEFLSLLKMEGVWMYVATATDRPLAEIALKKAGIRDYFRGILTCADVGRGKDDPEIFEAAMRRLRSTKRDTVVFEDALYAVRTAKAAGFRVAGVYDAVSEEDQEAIRSLSDYYIRSFEELFDTKSLE